MHKVRSVFRYRIRNWCEYNRALIHRGRLTVWFDEQAIRAWHHTKPTARPGAPRVYSDVAIECALVFKAVYLLSLRTAQGFLTSVVERMQLTRAPRTRGGGRVLTWKTPERVRVFYLEWFAPPRPFEALDYQEGSGVG